LARQQGEPQVAVLAGGGGVDALLKLEPERPGRMYGLISRLKAVTGRREELAAVLLEGSAGMPGCLSYVVARDLADPDALWVTEVWDSRESHRASLALPSVRQAVERGRPLIAGFGERHETEVAGGHGLGG